MSASPNTSVFVSIGYQGRTIDEFLSLLAEARVDVVVDVRLNAVSRKKGFSKSALAAALADVGIEYRHSRELGNPKENRGPFRQGLRSARTRYLRHLKNGASAAHNELLALGQTSRIALLCYEREHRECHRSCIIDVARNEDPSVSLIEM